MTQNTSQLTIHRGDLKDFDIYENKNNISLFVEFIKNSVLRAVYTFVDTQLCVHSDTEASWWQYKKRKLWTDIPCAHMAENPQQSIFKVSRPI